MPNLAFHFEVLNRVIQQLVQNGDSRGSIMANNKKFAVLGALGPDLLRYLPVSKPLADDLAAVALTNSAGQGQISSLPPQEREELFLNPLGGAYSVLFRLLVVPTWPVLNNIKDFLDRMDAIALAQDLLALPQMIAQENAIVSQSASLQSQLPGTVQSLAAIIAQIISLPPWMEQNLQSPVKPSDPRGCRLSEFLRWHHTGEFTRNLINSANNDQQKAFAYGYLSHVAASVTGEPLVNNITGGPYRTHWWRNRLVSNFIDSWTFGFFESNAQMQGDNPTPPYAAWTPLCGANLHNEFNVANADVPKLGDVPDAVKAIASGDLGKLTNQFPKDLATLLLTAVNLTYPTADQPIAGFTEDKLKQAFVGAFAVYWFMTSGSGPMCNNPIGPPPSNCMSAPSWVTSGSAPSPQQAGLNVGPDICAVLLAIVALLKILTGTFQGGVSAVIAAISVPIVDWDVVRCNLFWLRKELVDIENALRDALVQNGLAYPPPQKLGTIDTNGNTQPATDSTTNPPVSLCSSNNLGSSTYPNPMDATNPQAPVADLDFACYPFTGVELPSTQNLIPSGVYPNSVVNGTGLQNGGIMTDGTYPSRYQVFGDAVCNAVAAIQTDGIGLPNYNLDSDRGYGWKSWAPQPGSFPGTPPVVDVQE